MVIDSYYWFGKSTKRKASLSEFYSIGDVDHHKIVKHVNTRWLSLERAGLKSYFLSNGNISSNYELSVNR